MKKIIALLSVIALLASMAGCKDKKESTGSQIVDSGNVTSTADTAAPADPSVTAAPKSEAEVKEEMDNFAKNADENVDMKKIGGDEIKGESDKDKADLGGYEVSIENAVLADSERSKVLVVEFTFKNNTSQDTNFSSVIDVKAAQDDSQLPLAVTYSAEGYDVLTQAQMVKYNDTIKVQKAYVVTDTEKPVTVQVAKHDNIGGSEAISKTFNLK